jgi:hypothetical protein
VKNILIITSHYPPSNLTGVHRGRHIAKFLPQFGWNPIVLTVDPKSYEENLDHDLGKLLPPDQQIIRVGAFPITKPRLIGDLGLRAFFQLKKRAAQIIQTKKIDFIYIIIPSFYLALLGPVLFRSFRINYGIDYIDPWVHFFPGSEKKFSRHWFSTKFSKILEPIAVKRASIITSVSESYIHPIFERNQKLKSATQLLAFPYGWDPQEKEFIAQYKSTTQLFVKNNKLKLVYTGAFMPHSVNILKEWLKLINDNIEQFNNVEIHFIGTGAPKLSPNQISLTALAKEYNLYEKVIFEHPNRISYFDVLYHISIADGLFILGSSEAHYTPSKLFNAFITEKPIFAILHPNSSAAKIIDETDWGLTCFYSEERINEFNEEALREFKLWKHKTMTNSWSFSNEKARCYSAKQLTEKLATTLNELV